MRAGDSFIWLGLRLVRIGEDEAGPVYDERGTAYRSPRLGRCLYRRVGDIYLHAGDSHWRCPGCGGFMRKVEGGSESIDCQLCGAAPAPAVA